MHAFTGQRLLAMTTAYTKRKWYMISDNVKQICSLYNFTIALELRVEWVMSGMGLASVKTQEWMLSLNWAWLVV